MHGDTEHWCLLSSQIARRPENWDLGSQCFQALILEHKPPCARCLPLCALMEPPPWLLGSGRLLQVRIGVLGEVTLGRHARPPLPSLPSQGRAFCPVPSPLQTPVLSEPSPCWHPRAWGPFLRQLSGLAGRCPVR